MQMLFIFLTLQKIRDFVTVIFLHRCLLQAFQSVHFHYLVELSVILLSDLLVSNRVLKNEKSF